MGLQEKIEEIRQKPEHIRIRYVWMWVSISMVFVLAIWIVSLAAQNKKPEVSGASSQQLFEQFQSQKKSIEDTTNQEKSGFNAGSSKLNDTNQK